MLTQAQEDRIRNERLRGWIVLFLYKARPKPLEVASLRKLLDSYNYPLSRRRLAEELDYLRSLRVLKVFPAHAEAALTEVEQSKLVQRYAETESDTEMGEVLCARITAAGINFQDTVNDLDGITRVN